MRRPSTLHTSMCWGCVSRDKSWEVKFDLAFVFRGKNTSFFGTSVQFTCMIDNLVLKVQVRLNTKKKKNVRVRRKLAQLG